MEIYGLYNNKKLPVWVGWQLQFKRNNSAAAVNNTEFAFYSLHPAAYIFKPVTGFAFRTYSTCTIAVIFYYDS